MSQSKNWVFTLNNYTDEDISSLKAINCNYILLGYEVGENGTPHIQGFIQFEQKKRLTAMRKINSRIHWEMMRGTVKQATDYCKKDGKFEEIGAYTTTGQRNDLKVAYETWKESGKIRKVIENEPNNQVITTIEKVAKYCEKKRNFKPEVIWIYGDSGAGKSKLADELVENGDVYEKDDTKWWDGYDAHDIVVMDDFRDSNMRLNGLLKLLDRYAHRVEQKGTFRQMLAKKMIITSIRHPRDMYRKCAEVDQEPIQQLLRRIDKIIHVTDLKTLKS